jgi:hypothetical protein
MKWNYAHTFGELKPDVIVSLWDETVKEAEPYLRVTSWHPLGIKQTSCCAKIRRTSYGEGHDQEATGRFHSEAASGHCEGTAKVFHI